jgi:DSF synthase
LFRGEEITVSNLHDVGGLRLPYGRTGAQFQPEFERENGTIWGFMSPLGAPCFNLGILKDIREHDAALEANGGRVRVGGEWHDARYYVGASRIPGAYNLGGDLALFMLLIKARDRDALARYAAMCLDNLHARIQNYGCPTLTTISLVQGDALGGGFECALTSDVIIAEEQAQMGLPEILFNLFPGMGAYSLLARRIESAVQEWIAANARRRNGTQAVFRARQLVHPITRAELDAIAEVWVDAAMRLEERDLKMMSWLVRAQQRRMEETPAPLPVEPAGLAMAAAI